MSGLVREEDALRECIPGYTPRTQMGAVSDKALALVPPARAYMVTAKVSEKAVLLF